MTDMYQILYLWLLATPSLENPDAKPLLQSSQSKSGSTLCRALFEHNEILSLMSFYFCICSVKDDNSSMFLAFFLTACSIHELFYSKQSFSWYDFEWAPGISWQPIKWWSFHIHFFTGPRPDIQSGSVLDFYTVHTVQTNPCVALYQVSTLSPIHKELCICAAELCEFRLESLPVDQNFCFLWQVHCVTACLCVHILRQTRSTS